MGVGAFVDEVKAKKSGNILIKLCVTHFNVTIKEAINHVRNFKTF